MLWDPLRGPLRDPLRVSLRDPERVPQGFYMGSVSIVLVPTSRGGCGIDCHSLCAGIIKSREKGFGPRAFRAQGYIRV